MVRQRTLLEEESVHFLADLNFCDMCTRQRKAPQPLGDAVLQFLSLCVCNT